ncbi:TPA: hypothetical protein OCX28_004699 [Escherichia coli]|nr:hypothetical protein [Escherichia coli]
MNKIIIASLFLGVGFISLPSFATQELSGFYLSGKLGGSAIYLVNQSYSYKDLDCGCIRGLDSSLFTRVMSETRKYMDS